VYGTPFGQRFARSTHDGLYLWLFNVIKSHQLSNHKLLKLHYYTAMICRHSVCDVSHSAVSSK